MYRDMTPFRDCNDLFSSFYKFAGPVNDECVKESGCFYLNQRAINRCRNRDLSWETTFYDLEPPFLSQKSYIPLIWSPYVDETRAKLAFGDWDVRRLDHQLKKAPDVLFLMQLLNSINDLMWNPEKGMHAVMFRLVETLIEFLVHEKYFVREKVCQIFCTLASQEVGNWFMMVRFLLQDNLFQCVQDDVYQVRIAALQAFEMMSRYFKAADVLNELGYFRMALRLLKEGFNEEEIRLQLKTMEHLLDRDIVSEALYHEAMEIMITKVEDAHDGRMLSKNKQTKEEVIWRGLRCIMLLCREDEGKEEAIQLGIVQRVMPFMAHSNPDIEHSAAMVLMFTTLKKEGKEQMMEQSFIDHLFEMMEDTGNRDRQIEGMRVLTNIAELPEGRALLHKKVNRHRVKNLNTHKDSVLEKERGILEYTIYWKP